MFLTAVPAVPQAVAKGLLRWYGWGGRGPPPVASRANSS